jgi:hypothetical protein
MSKHIIVKSVTNNLFLVDDAGIGGRNMSLPGEILPPRSWRRKSAEVIVLMIRAGIGLHTPEDSRKRKD